MRDTRPPQVGDSVRTAYAPCRARITPGALWLLEQLPPMEPVFGLTARQIDVMWRRGRDRAAVENLTFHDLRHLAITRLSRRLGPLELARMVGHADIRQLMVYYNESASETAGKL